jgi:hypothetical protein
MVDVPELPRVIVIVLGLALRAKLGFPPPPARSLIKPLPAGLPQPVAKS